MAQGRGNSAVIALMLLFLMLVFQQEIAHAETYTVGYGNGWTFNVSTWADGKRFQRGDILVFDYNPKLHNVAVVDEGEYRACTASTRDKVYQTGHDQVFLPPGQSYYISSFPGDCDGGMKFSVYAE